MTYSIYTLNDEHGNTFYVGQSKNPYKRFRRHVSNAKWEHIYPVHRKLRKVLELVSDPSFILKVIENDIPIENVDSRETFYINKFKNAGMKLLNLTNGGDGFKGITPEIIAKIVSKNRGQKRTPEQIERISESLRGKKFTKSHRKALKKAWQTRPPWPSDRGEILSKLNSGKINIKQFLVVSPSNEQFVTDRGLSDFCRNHNLSVSNLHKTLNGLRPHHKGWKILREISP